MTTAASAASSPGAVGPTSSKVKVKVKKNARPKFGPLALEKYLPLGTIRYEPNTASAPAAQVQEIGSNPSSYLPERHELGRHLDTLYLNGWIRIFVLQIIGCTMAAMRVYLLPDDIGRGVVPREDKKVRSSLKVIMAAIVSSAESWDGLDTLQLNPHGYEPICSEQDSLFYMFNTLQSPQPDPLTVTNSHASLAMGDILEDSRDYLGLKTRLYDYQRRSAAMMIQREAQPALRLDSRLEVLCGPTGRQFYFDRIAGQILSEKRSYEETRGGILAETMGHGKTLISLAVVIATKGHLPQVPLEYQTELRPRRSDDSNTGAASLKEMVRRAIYQHAVPWKPYFNDLAKQGEFPETCRRFIQETPSWYSIPDPPRARRISYRQTEEKKIFLSSNTLIVVPTNLMNHWQQEVATHLEKDALSMVVFLDDAHSLPTAEELLKLDVILMSKTRFEDEIAPRKNNLIGKLGKSGARGFTSLHSCCCSGRKRACPIHEYRSSLLDIHFLRFIVDEGHNFASATSNRATAGLRSIHVERKWIISGTPSKGLLGLEIDMATEYAADGEGKSSTEQQQDILEKRRMRPSAELEGKDLAALGHAVTNFLGLQPWANSRSQEDSASWQSYLVPDATGMRKAGNLRCVLESLVVRHQINEIEKDLELPPLNNKIVYLQPCYSDKITLNLFTLIIVSNAITSERADEDYMFHTKNKSQLEKLIKNLRQAGFHYPGWSCDEVSESVRIGQEYLDKHGNYLSAEDEKMLKTAVAAGEMALDTMGWKAHSESKELGLLVENFPIKYETRWGLYSTEDDEPALIGLTQLIDAQTDVDGNIFASDPFKVLARRDRPATWDSGSVPVSQTSPSSITATSPKKGQGAVSAARKVIMNSSLEASQKLTPREFNMHKARSRTRAMTPDTSESNEDVESAEPGLKSAIKSQSRCDRPLPEAYDKVSKVKLIATSCAKLSYLLDRVLELHEHEKILIFYDADHVAYYVGQALEVLQIPHAIYATGIKVEMKARYLEKFNKGQHTRVLLMDLKQAAHGLHVASASRVFFINPVWNPSTEAQAIKRAHRIGQTRPVFAETLVLTGTMEAKMLERRKAMTTSEHQKASKSPLDDLTMNDIIKAAEFQNVCYEHVHQVVPQMAPLKVPQQVFGREFIGRGPGRATAPRESEATNEGSAPTDKTNLKKRKAAFLDELEESYPPKSPRLESHVEPTCKPFRNELSTPIAKPASQKRKATFADEVDEVDEVRASKISRLHEPPTGMANSNGTQAHTSPGKPIPPSSQLYDPRAVLAEAEAVANKWKQFLVNTMDSPDTAGVSGFTGILSPSSTSGDERGGTTGVPGASKERKTADEEDESAPKAKSIRFAA
ncbi:MAG: hypothetical protein LQ340_005927 [Diploschistes diacapsis]|nr:MAG: hypothetical protein LQ340_005927 [Diploschistes diacapsis]